MVQNRNCAIRGQQTDPFWPSRVPERTRAQTNRCNTRVCFSVEQNTNQFSYCSLVTLVSVLFEFDICAQPPPCSRMTKHSIFSIGRWCLRYCFKSIIILTVKSVCLWLGYRNRSSGGLVSVLTCSVEVSQTRDRARTHQPEPPDGINFN